MPPKLKTPILKLVQNRQIRIFPAKPYGYTVFAPVAGRKKHTMQRKLLKVRTSIGASWSGLHHQHAATTTTTTDQISTSKGATGVNDAAINTTCVRLNGVPYYLSN